MAFPAEFGGFDPRTPHDQGAIAPVTPRNNPDRTNSAKLVRIRGGKIIPVDPASEMYRSPKLSGLDVNRSNDQTQIVGLALYTPGLETPVSPDVDTYLAIVGNRTDRTNNQAPLVESATYDISVVRFRSGLVDPADPLSEPTFFEDSEVLFSGINTTAFGAFNKGKSALSARDAALIQVAQAFALPDQQNRNTFPMQDRLKAEHDPRDPEPMRVINDTMSGDRIEGFDTFSINDPDPNVLVVFLEAGATDDGSELSPTLPPWARRASMKPLLYNVYANKVVLDGSGISFQRVPEPLAEGRRFLTTDKALQYARETHGTNVSAAELAAQLAVARVITVYKERHAGQVIDEEKLRVNLAEILPACQAHWEGQGEAFALGLVSALKGEEVTDTKKMGEESLIAVLKDPLGARTRLQQYAIDNPELDTEKLGNADNLLLYSALFGSQPTPEVSDEQPRKDINDDDNKKRS